MSEFYLTLFTEAYLRFFLIPLDSQRVLPAMTLFGGYNMAMPIMITGVGIVLALLSSFIIGLGLGQLREVHFTHVLSDERYTKVNAFTRRYGIFFLLLVWLPLGTLIPAVLGFFWKKN